ncbi:hypothetical protein PM082_013974 [Marasmius tenuissimus]|nr:hypothetical protein PM082_013974 [Marasmius tenuissimus]
MDFDVLFDQKSLMSRVHLMARQYYIEWIGLEERKKVQCGGVMILKMERVVFPVLEQLYTRFGKVSKARRAGDWSHARKATEELTR